MDGLISGLNTLPLLQVKISGQGGSLRMILEEPRFAFVLARFRVLAQGFLLSCRESRTSAISSPCSLHGVCSTFSQVLTLTETA